MRYVIFIIVMLTIPTFSYSATIEVPKDYATIQLAIDASVNGDVIIVAPGTYVENIDYKGKAITVMSSGGAAVTSIDGNQTGSVVLCKTGEGLDSVLDGFTITNGSGTLLPSMKTNAGGGICCAQSSPTIKGCYIKGNYCDNGPGVFLETSWAMIQDNILSDNGTTDYPVTGSGIFMWSNSAPEVRNNLFYHNEAYAGAGMYIGASHPNIVNNTFYGNNSKKKGGGIWYQNNTGVEANITNNILWKNIAAFQKEISIDSGSPIVTYCDVDGGWTGTGNINADPLLIDPDNGDFHLQQDPCQPGVTNPCVDSGSDTAFNLSMHSCWTRSDGVPDSGIVDMGFHYGHFTKPSFQTDIYKISESTGGVANFTLIAGKDNANRNYIILGSASGISPGIALPGGKVTLPLNWDIMTNTVIDYLNTALFSKFVGMLDGTGSANAKFDTLGSIPGTSGLTFYFAYALNKPWDFASNPVSIEITP